jgi:hypothetical protein
MSDSSDAIALFREAERCNTSRWGNGQLNEVFIALAYRSAK